MPFYDLAESFRNVASVVEWLVFFDADFERTRTTHAEVLKLWDDDVSRAHHLQFLAWRRLREEWSFEISSARPDCDRLFHPGSNPRLLQASDEILIDGGAHHGQRDESLPPETLQMVLFEQIVAIEPDCVQSRACYGKTLQSWLPE